MAALVKPNNALDLQGTIFLANLACFRTKSWLYLCIFKPLNLSVIQKILTSLTQPAPGPNFKQRLAYERAVERSQQLKLGN